MNKIKLLGLMLSGVILLFTLHSVYVLWMEPRDIEWMMIFTLIGFAIGEVFCIFAFFIEMEEK